MESRDRLVTRICIVPGLRPGEVLAVKWDDFDAESGHLRIDELAVDWQIKDTKTPGSRAWVWLPKSITEELLQWRATGTSMNACAVKHRPNHFAPTAPPFISPISAGRSRGKIRG